VRVALCHQNETRPAAVRASWPLEHGCLKLLLKRQMASPEVDPYSVAAVRRANALLAWRFLAHSNNLDAAVEATMGADVVWSPQVVALGALDKLCDCQTVVRATLVTSRA
jgi:hypothetical protein